MSRDRGMDEGAGKQILRDKGKSRQIDSDFLKNRKKNVGGKRCGGSK